MRVAFAGTPEFAAVALEALLADRADDVPVVVRSDEGIGEAARILSASPS